MSRAESIGGRGLEFVVGEGLATCLAATEGTVTEALEGQFHVGELSLDGVEFAFDVDRGEVDIALDVGAVDGTAHIGAARGTVGLHDT